MKRILIIIFLLSAVNCFGGIPNMKDYEFGTLEVPENYDISSSRKIKIYWEKLKSFSKNPEAIVAINGGPGLTHSSWHDQLANGGYKKDVLYELRTNFDIYYFDQRGTGNSEPVTYDNIIRRDMRRYGTSEICKDIDELRKRVIKKDKIVVLGESYGGMAALHYAVNYPDNLLKLVLHDTSPSNDYMNNLHVNYSSMLEVLDEKLPGVCENLKTVVEMFDNGQVTNAHNVTVSSDFFLSVMVTYTYSLQGQITIAFIAQEIVTNGSSTIFDAILAGLLAKQRAFEDFSSVTPPTCLVQCLEMFNSSAVASSKDASPWTKAWAEDFIFSSRRSFKEYYSLSDFYPYNVISKLNKITAPALVMVGETDFICPPKYAQTIKDGIGDNCTMVVIKNAAHSGLYEQHEFTMSRIRSFLMNTYPSRDVTERPLEDFLAQPVTPESALEVWLDNAAKYGTVISPNRNFQVFDRQILRNNVPEIHSAEK